MEHKAVPE